MYLGDATLTDRIGDNVEAAVAYLRSKWTDFLRLESGILDLQHRAARAAYAAAQAGDHESAELARASIRKLGELGKLHVKAVDTMRSVAGAVGLSGYRLGAIPFAQVAVVTSLALTVAWFFRAYAAEERKLDMIEKGILTPEQAAALDVGPSPAGVLGGVAGLGKVLLWGGALFVLAKAIEAAAAWRDNPALEVWENNPPGEPIGRRVYAVLYRHAEDGGRYIHEFRPGVELSGEADGSVRLASRTGRPLWRDF